MKCNCESAYCAHHGGDPSGEYPTADRCPNDADGRFRMTFVGVVCEACAKVPANAPVVHGPGEEIDREDAGQLHRAGLGMFRPQGERPKARAERLRAAGLLGLNEGTGIYFLTNAGDEALHSSPWSRREAREDPDPDLGEAVREAGGWSEHADGTPASEADAEAKRRHERMAGQLEAEAKLRLREAEGLAVADARDLKKIAARVGTMMSLPTLLADGSAYSPSWRTLPGGAEVWAMDDPDASERYQETLDDELERFEHGAFVWEEGVLFFYPPSVRRAEDREREEIARLEREQALIERWSVTGLKGEGPLTLDQTRAEEAYEAHMEEQDREHELERAHGGRSRCEACGEFAVERHTVSTGYDDSTYTRCSKCGHETFAG